MNAPPGGAPKPPPELWAELEAAGPRRRHRLRDRPPLAHRPRPLQDVAARAGHRRAPRPLHGHAPTRRRGVDLIDDDRGRRAAPPMPKQSGRRRASRSPQLTSGLLGTFAAGIPFLLEDDEVR
jgi:hypothetical protein